MQLFNVARWEWDWARRTRLILVPLIATIDDGQLSQSVNYIDFMHMQSEASYAMTQNLDNIVPGDKYREDQTSGSKSKIDAMYDFMERDSDSLKTSGTVNPFAAVTDGQ